MCVEAGFCASVCCRVWLETWGDRETLGLEESVVLCRSLGGSGAKCLGMTQSRKEEGASPWV